MSMCFFMCHLFAAGHYLALLGITWHYLAYLLLEAERKQDTPWLSRHLMALLQQPLQRVGPFNSLDSSVEHTDRKVGDTQKKNHCQNMSKHVKTKPSWGTQLHHVDVMSTSSSFGKLFPPFVSLVQLLPADNHTAIEPTGGMVSSWAPKLGPKFSSLPQVLWKLVKVCEVLWSSTMFYELKCKATTSHCILRSSDRASTSPSWEVVKHLTYLTGT